MNPIALAETTREYRLTTGWRIFAYLFTPILMVAGGFLAVLPFIDDTVSSDAEYILVPMGLGMAVFMLYAFLEIHFGKIRLSRGRIEQMGVLGNKELLISEIKGFEVDSYYIRIYPVEKSKPTIKIGVVGMEVEEIVQWLQLRKNNLEHVTYQEEEQAILSNSAIGLTEQERHSKLTEARKVASWLNGIAFAIMGWLSFYPFPYKIAIWTGILYPLVLVTANFYYKGIFRINEKNNSAHPSVTAGLLLTGMAVAYRSFCDVEIVSFSAIWPWAASATLLFFSMMLFSTNEFSFSKAKDVGAASLFLLLLSFYGYGVPVHANRLLDTSVAVVYQVKVLEKNATSSSNTMYYLTLEPWGPRTEPEKVSVSSHLYESVLIGGTIPIQLYSGALNVPYLLLE